MKSKVLQNKEEKKEKLLAAAFHLLLHKDIQDVSISEIANSAGIAKGTFYLYFRDKYDLRDVLIAQESEKILQTALDRLESNDIRSFEDAIIYLINQILIQLESNPMILKFIKMNLSWGLFDHKLSEAYQKDQYALLERFTQEADQNGYHFDHPDYILFLILEMTSSVCYNSILFQTPAALDQVKPVLFNSIRAILAQGKPQ